MNNPINNQLNPSTRSSMAQETIDRATYYVVDHPFFGIILSVVDEGKKPANRILSPPFTCRARANEWAAIQGIAVGPRLSYTHRSSMNKELDRAHPSIREMIKG